MAPRPTPARLAVIVGSVFGLGAAVDLLLGRPTEVLLPTLWSLGLGLGVGGAVGGALGLGLRLLQRAPRAVVWLVWLGAGAAAGWWLAAELGAWARLQGPYRALALAALGGSLLVAAAVSSVALALQPSRRHAAGWLASLSGRSSVVAVALCMAAAIVALFVDRLVQPSEYRPAHVVLRWVSIVAVGVAVHLTVGAPQLARRLRRGLGAALGVVVAVPFVSVREHHYVALDAMLSAPLSHLALQSARRLGDFDGDGHSLLLGGGDCAPFDGAVHPSAREIAGNGLDDNCRRGDAAAPPPAEALVAAPQEPSPVSVVLVTVDALCVRRLSLHGAKRRTTPRLDAWARDALVFERAYTAGGWTSLSLSALFRGRYARRLQFTRVVETDRDRLLREPIESQLSPGEGLKRVFGLPLGDPRQPLWWWLQRRGMYAVAVVDDGRSAFLSSAVGAFAGFDRYVEMDHRPPEQRNDAGVTAAALAELEAMPLDQEFFLWVHYYGPHKPSTRHPGVELYGESAADRYDHEVRFADEQLGPLLDAVEAEALQRALVIIVASDHGESFAAGSRGHGWNLQEDAIRVPLLLKLPGLRGRRVEQLATLIDIMPTILAVTETPAPAGLDGHDLRAVARGAFPERVLLSDVWHATGHGEPKRDMAAVFDGQHKLVIDFLTGARRLTTQQDEGGNLLGRVKATHLEAALDQYLETAY